MAAHIEQWKEELPAKAIELLKLNSRTKGNPEGASQPEENKKIHVLSCSDKYKDSATADQINGTICNVLEEAFPGHVTTSQLYLSDGGDGFLASLRAPLHLTTVQTSVTGPLCTSVTAAYGINEEKKLAVIEMAAASGLELVPSAQRNPLHTTTRGTGELIADAYARGCRKVLLGIGGSATSDGGLGAMQALGLHIYTKDGLVVEPACGKHMSQVVRLEFANAVPELEIDIACDVTSPFVGPEGAVAVFSAQKGATPEIQTELEAGMQNLSGLIQGLTGVDLRNKAGAGAAGGIGGAMHAFMNAKLLKGVEIMGASVDLEQHIARSQLVITGEGKYDSQTAAGKVVSYVQDLCDKHNVPCVVVCGCNEAGHTDNVYDLLSRFPLEKCMGEPLVCLRQVVQDNVHQFPVLRNL